MVGGFLTLLFLVGLGSVGSSVGCCALNHAVLCVGRKSRYSLDGLIVELSQSRRSIRSATQSEILLNPVRCIVLTATMDSKMKPAAAASFAPSAEYTKAFTTELVKTRPADKNPTTFPQLAMFPTQLPESIAYRNVIGLC